MNYGPLEFADYLQRIGRPDDSATVKAARAAQPSAARPVNEVRVVSGPRALTESQSTSRGRVVVYEAVAMNPPGDPRRPGVVRVLIGPTEQPLVVVLTSHQRVEWRISREPGASLSAVLLAGFGHSTVLGDVGATVHRIGGFCAFKRGSEAYLHLESEVLRCTGRAIAAFKSVYAGDHFEIGLRSD